MISRRGFLAGTAAALLADATGPSFAQQTARTRVIDIHAHWYPPQWLELVEKEAGANGGRVERNARGNMVIVIPGLSVTFQPQYTDIPSRLKHMDQAGVAIRGFFRDPAPVDERHRETALLQVQCAADADDAGAEHDRVGRGARAHSRP